MRTFKLAALVALTASTLALSGCSSLNPFSSSDSKNKPAELVNITPSLNVRTLWNANVGTIASGTNTGAGFQPTVAQGRIYAASADGTVTALDAATGRSVFRVTAGTRLSAGAGSDGTTTAVVTLAGEVIAFGPEGTIKWRAPAGGTVNNPPFVGQGVVAIRTDDGRIQTFDDGTGKRRWSYSRTAPPLVLRTPAGMAANASTLFVANANGRLLAMNINTGAVRWDGAIANPRGATELERVVDAVGLPQLSGREVCSGAFQGRVVCFDSQSGTALWTRDLSVLGGVGADVRFVFASDETSTVHALSRDGGASVWKQDKLLYRGLAAPFSLGKAVLVGDKFGYVHWLARDTGNFVARSTTDGSAVLGTPVGFEVGGVTGAVVQTASGGLYAFAAD